MSDIMSGVIEYRIVLPYQEVGHEYRPWFLSRVEAFDGQAFIGCLKMAWVDYEWVRENFVLAAKVTPTSTWTWINQRGNWVYVDYSRVSYIYRRRGIATRMYKLGAAWAARHRNTMLHGSSLRSEAALALWESLKGDDLPVVQVSDERHTYDCLDYSQTLALRLRAKRLLAHVPLVAEGHDYTLFLDTNPQSVLARNLARG